MQLSQNVSGRAGSYTIAVGPLSMVAEPAPVPRWNQVLPPSSVAHSPLLATPAITRPESGLADTMVRSPPPAACVARSPVTLAHDDAAGGTLGAAAASGAAMPAPAVPAVPAAASVAARASFAPASIGNAAPPPAPAAPPGPASGAASSPPPRTE